MVKEVDMELNIMNWKCPECGLSLSKHLTEIICPVSDVDAPEPASPEVPGLRAITEFKQRSKKTMANDKTPVDTKSRLASG